MNFKTLNVIGLLFFGLFTLTSCDKDDDNTDPIEEDEVMLFATNNANGNISAYHVDDLESVPTHVFMTQSTAADGVYFNPSTNELVIASRSSMGVEAFSNISFSSSTTNVDVSLGVLDSAVMDSPRGMAVSGNYYVVADNMDVDSNALTHDGRFFVYQRDSDGFTLRNIITTDIKLWGITFIGDDLYAVADDDDQLVMYEDFLNNDSTAMLMPSKRVVIEGIVRTHGLDYDQTSNTMVMTDIGSASNTTDDGAIHIIPTFMTKFDSAADGGTISLTDQIRISGASTLLGNPVDVAYDGDTDIVYVAEAGNGGGRILGFSNATQGGNLTPEFNMDMTAASSVFLVRM